jgi:hypothetical protein
MVTVTAFHSLLSMGLAQLWPLRLLCVCSVLHACSRIPFSMYAGVIRQLLLSPNKLLRGQKLDCKAAEQPDSHVL